MMMSFTKKKKGVVLTETSLIFLVLYHDLPQKHIIFIAIRIYFCLSYTNIELY